MRALIDRWIRRKGIAAQRRAATARICGIRGAIDVEADTPVAIRAAVAKLIEQLEARNSLTSDEIISAIFTTTPDLVSIFPALAARDAGWSEVPMLCATEVAVPRSLPLCLRVLVHVELPRERIVEHVYLGAAASLRPDLARPSFARAPGRERPTHATH